MRKSYVYMLTNEGNSVLYTGVTSNLERRILQHRAKVREGFTQRYNLNKLVYVEEFGSIIDAIEREKKIKMLSRHRKELLIQQQNPAWRDLMPVDDY
ncbi:MAG: GIY-YIG nuclease family protein [Tidjanibacter sp.]|nr:GIY-YIG nuclease family protein [Tidjanibacter sp.]